MLDKLKKIIEHNEKIVFLPKSDELYLDAFSDMYGKCIVFDESDVNDYKKIVDEINSSKLKEIYFVNFINTYRKVMPEINKKIKVYELITVNVANLTSIYVLPIFYDVAEFYERQIIKKIYAVDKSMYQILKNAGYNVERAIIKMPFNNDKFNLENKKNNSIGILSTDYDPVHNFYNMLTSISLVENYDKVKLISHMNATRDFFNHFDIRHEFCDSLDEVMKDNFVNLYCNFTNTNPYLIFKSMDNGIPCIVGNTDIFDDNEFLKETLVLKSDDDVNEIAIKINSIKDNYDKIFEEYKKIRKDMR